MAERVTRVLRRRGAPPTTIDDAIQTAALRALCRHEGFDSFDGLVSWVIVVAWHEVQAEWRHAARADLGEVPENPVGPDPAAVVESHIALDAVADGLSSLSDAEREAILAPLVDDAASEGSDDAREKMRRHRARRHLADLVERTER
ncbi:MAG TPA: sigma factor [Acidimicrobiales bacterium]|nr:sigma factor [Acidimicrobiales bacterium]